MCDLISGKCLANISSLLIAVFLFIRVACCFKKFTESWDVVKNGIPEDVTHSKHWAGSFYEDQDYNIKITKSIWSCKTYYRNENKSFELEGSLQSSEKLPSYITQTQQQMACTDASFVNCLLTTQKLTGNFFLIQKDNVLVDVIMDECNFIYNYQLFNSWSHTEIKELQIFGEKIAW